MSPAVEAQVGWGFWWIKGAADYPAYAAACAHNANMNAMMVLALEACQ